MCLQVFKQCLCLVVLAEVGEQPNAFVEVFAGGMRLNGLDMIRVLAPSLRAPLATSHLLRL